MVLGIKNSTWNCGCSLANTLAGREKRVRPI